MRILALKFIFLSEHDVDLNDYSSPGYLIEAELSWFVSLLSKAIFQDIPLRIFQFKYVANLATVAN